MVQAEARRFYAFLALSQTSMVMFAVMLHTPTSLTAALCLWVSIVLSLAGLGFSVLFAGQPELVGQGALDQDLHVGGFAHVGRHKFGARAECAQFAHDAVGGLRIEIGDHHRRSLTGKRPGNTLAKARYPTRDNSHFAS